MKLYFICFIFVFNVFASKKDSYLVKNFLNQEEFDLFISKLNYIKSSSFDLQSNLNEFFSPEFKIALTALFLDEIGDLKKVKFADLTNLYFFYLQYSKKKHILSLIQKYIINFNLHLGEFDEKFREVEQMIWFFLMIDNKNFNNYLRNNKLTVQNFINNIKETKNFQLFINIIYPIHLRASILIWNSQLVNATKLIDKMPNSYEKDVLMARMYFKTKNNKYKLFAKKVIKKGKFEDDGLVYDYIKFLSKTKYYSKSLSLISNLNIDFDTVNSIKLWNLIQNLVYEYLENKNYVGAYQLVSKLTVNDQKNVYIFYRSHFLAGLIALKFLNEPHIAIYHFNLIYKSSNTSFKSKAKSAYFISQAYKILKKKSLAKTWLQNASKFVNTFYGILAIEEFNNIEPVLFFGLQKYSDQKIKDHIQKRNSVHKIYLDSLINTHYNTPPMNVENEIKQNTAFKIGIIMLYLDRPEDASVYFEISKDGISSNNLKQVFDLLNNFLTANNVKTKNRILNAFASKAADKGVIIVENYPIIDFVINSKSVKNKALIHAVIKQESNFVVKAISGAGALGLMQILPSTGKLVSRNSTLNFNLWRLKNDYKYNILIGSFYLNKLLIRFQNSYPYSIASYNAGPNKIIHWKKKYFEIDDLQDMLTLLELIPYNETREYVFKVFKNEIIYNYLLQNHIQKSSLPISKFYHK